MMVVQTKTAIKYLAWAAALSAVSIGMVYAFWSVLIFMLYDNQLMQGFSAAAGLVMFGLYWWLLRMAS